MLLPNTINQELIVLQEWFNSNKLTLNINKTKYIVFRSNKKDVNTDGFQICTGNSILEEVSSFKYLGLTYACYALLKARQCFDTPTMKPVYFAIFHSHLTYCIEAWGITYHLPFAIDQITEESPQNLDILPLFPTVTYHISSTSHFHISGN
ncbi:uncharacterized protein LOC121837309 [Ixodes scapularis]|uniref:uncharacterized protein LOC121837309 n=1 Tax=Ixodes scapularis TaxID=6945 RepID=UPI001C388C5A|nr:uncharacterized protein LOC121837309 [Ixodes scapularis]